MLPVEACGCELASPVESVFEEIARIYRCQYMLR